MTAIERETSGCKAVVGLMSCAKTGVAFPAFRFRWRLLKLGLGPISHHSSHATLLDKIAFTHDRVYCEHLFEITYSFMLKM